MAYFYKRRTSNLSSERTTVLEGTSLINIPPRPTRPEEVAEEVHCADLFKAAVCLAAGPVEELAKTVSELAESHQTESRPVRERRQRQL